MISCALLQLTLCAHQIGAPDEAASWRAAAEKLWALHRCLTLSETPDARAAGATLRWWETQYTVCLMANCLNTPCGWTAWKLYGNLYLYLLTGREACLTQYFDGLGACLQLFDHATGRLRWGFTPSPAIHARYAAKAPDGAPREFVWKEGWFGECYIEPISDWNRDDPIWRKKWGIDNFVHEIVKCLAEGAYLTAFVHQRDDGSLLCYGAEARADAAGLAVSPLPDADRPTRLVLRLARPAAVRWEGRSRTLPAGLHVLGEPYPWMRPGAD